MAPLRERTDDILYLAKRFPISALELGKEVSGITQTAVERLLSYRWPGNVRELRNVIRRAVLLADQEVDVRHLGIGSRPCHNTAHANTSPNERLDERSLKDRMRESIAKVERAILSDVMRQTNGNKAIAARILQIDYKTISSKTRQYSIEWKKKEDDSHVAEGQE